MLSDLDFDMLSSTDASSFLELTGQISQILALRPNTRLCQCYLAHEAAALKIKLYLWGYTDSMVCLLALSVS